MSTLQNWFAAAAAEWASSEAELTAIDGETGDGDLGFTVSRGARAIGDALSALGIDHSAPDVAVATEGFRPLTRALKHLLAASATGLELVAEGRRDEVRAAAELDAESEATRLA